MSAEPPHQMILASTLIPRSEPSHPLALTQLFLVYHLLRARQSEEVEV